jgi:hypothetical protein
MSNSDNRVEKVLEDRRQQYGDAWTQTALMILPVKAAFDHMMEVCPRYVNAWWTILSKLVRLLYNPTHYDSWLDIAGYATLVCRDLEGSQPSNEVGPGLRTVKGREQ